MNLGELREAARYRLDDITPDYLWSDAELNQFINKAVDEACLRARFNVDSTSPDTSLIAVTAGQAEYDLHESVFFIKRAYLATTQRILLRAGFEDLDASNAKWMSVTGTPEMYIMDLDYYGDGGQTQRLRLYPIPTVDESLLLTVFRLPLAPLVSDGDIPEIPPMHHYDLLDWVCHLAYLKTDADTLNVEKAVGYQVEFMNSFGTKPSAQEVDWRRKQRRKRVTGRYL